MLYNKQIKHESTELGICLFIIYYSIPDGVESTEEESCGTGTFLHV